jgi:hypothetical protein
VIRPSGLLVLGLAACSNPVEIHGTVLDARTEAPVAGVSVRAAAEDAACVRSSGPTDEAGRFTILGLCPDAEYVVEPVDPTWLCAEPVMPRKDTLLRAWRVPESDGFYALRGEIFEQLLTNTPVVTIVLQAGGTARYPMQMPEVVPVLSDGDLFVAAGFDPVRDWSVLPVSPSGRRTLVMNGEGSVMVLDPWYWLGTTEDPTTGALVASPAPSLPEAMMIGERRVVYADATTLPAGRYALTPKEDGRAALFDVTHAASP